MGRSGLKVGMLWSIVATVLSGRRTRRPRARRPVKACGEVTSWIRCRSIYRTAGDPGSWATTWASQIFSNIVSVDKSKSQEWAASGAPQPGPRVYSVNLPVGKPADQQCGKGVHIDVHANQSGSDAVGTSYPSTCNSALKPAETLLAFFLFDLSSCIQNEAEPPKPPPVK